MVDTATAESTEKKIYVILYNDIETTTGVQYVILKAENARAAVKKLHDDIGHRVPIHSVSEFTQEELDNDIYCI